ncbi:acyl carrier protein [Hydrocarboniphaga sp.]|uniref:acyl carrier protein n=1 Tax=Hydrocarboniphaga sp. TaxID=2033016 RepID=UPI00261ADB49|nr:acyl carrier protein [Hydrocarboniphaga sp.]
MNSSVLVPQDVQSVLEDVVDHPIADFSATTNATVVEGWDSLNNVRFLLRLEQEFNVSFPVDRIGKLKNIGDLVDLINELRTK